MPFFSVIIPTYNRRTMLPRAIHSVLSQRSCDFELIIVDDGSTDGTGALASGYKGKLTMIHQKQSGVSAARNRGILESTGEYITFLDSDDEWLPTKLEEHRHYINSHPMIRIHQTDDIWIRKGRRVNPGKNHLKHEGDIFALSLKLCLISPSAVAIHRSLLKERGFFDELLPCCEDYDLWLRITLFENVGLIKKSLTIRYGGHEDQLSERFWGMDRFRAYSILKLLSTEGDRLDADKKIAAHTILIKKLEILRQGAIKRGKKDYAHTVEEIIRLSVDECYSSIDYRILAAE